MLVAIFSVFVSPSNLKSIKELGVWRGMYNQMTSDILPLYTKYFFLSAYVYNVNTQVNKGHILAALHLIAGCLFFLNAEVPLQHTHHSLRLVELHKTALQHLVTHLFPRFMERSAETNSCIPLWHLCCANIVYCTKIWIRKPEFLWRNYENLYAAETWLFAFSKDPQEL